MYNNMKELSIGIPTYNRKKQLKKQLESLLAQDLSEVEEIIVLDNNSNYNIKKLIDSLNSNKIKLIINPINQGMSINVLNPFLYCKTKWLWLLSDDDLTLKSSISNILEGIRNSYYDTGLIQFSLFDHQESFYSKNLNQYIDYYFNESEIRKGEIVFLSTKVFNVEVLNKYLAKGFEYSYTYIGFLIPIFIALNEQKISVFFNSNKIVEYLPPEGDEWNFDKVGKGLSTLSHLDLDLNKKYKKKMLEVFMPISYVEMYKFYLSNKHAKNASNYDIIYHNSYKFYLNIFQKSIYQIFKNSLKISLTYIVFKYIKRIYLTYKHFKFKK